MLTLGLKIVVRMGLYGGAWLLLGCGVRGDPIPPGYPAELGRGRPTYQQPKNRLQPRALPSSKDLKSEDEENSEKDQ